MLVACTICGRYLLKASTCERVKLPCTDTSTNESATSGKLPRAANSDTLLPEPRVEIA